MVVSPDFTQKTVTTLAKRVNFRCSNPHCRLPTSGPHEDPEKATIVGEAAHIRDARFGTSRYDPNMTNAQRRHIDNAIWLCSKCHTMIDANPDRYPEELLLKWKAQAQQRAQDELEGKVSLQDETTMVVSLTTEVLNSLHELDNAIRKTVGPLTRFDHITWEGPERKAAIKEIQVLADTEVILPRVRQLLPQLEEIAKELSISPEGMRTIDTVLTCGRETLKSLGPSDYTPWFTPHEVSELIAAILSADSIKKAKSVKKRARKVTAVVNRKLLREADELLGHFKVTVSV